MIGLGLLAATVAAVMVFDQQLTTREERVRRALETALYLAGALGALYSDTIGAFLAFATLGAARFAVAPGARPQAATPAVVTLATLAFAAAFGAVSMPLSGLSEHVGAAGTALIVLVLWAREGLFPLHVFHPRGARTRLYPDAGLIGLAKLAAVAAPVATGLGEAFVLTVTVLGILAFGIMALAEPKLANVSSHVSQAHRLLVAAAALLAPAETAPALLAYAGAALVAIILVDALLRAVSDRTGIETLPHGMQGLGEIMPRFGGAFLAAILAAMNFPLAFGFFGEDMLLESLAHRHVLGTGLIVAGFAVLGMGLLRLYFQLFGGISRVQPLYDLDLRKRETWPLAAALAMSVLAGFLPSLLLLK